MPLVDPLADRIRNNLSGQVDLDGRVDRDHVVVAANFPGVINQIRCMELDKRVAIDEVVQV